MSGVRGGRDRAARDPKEGSSVSMFSFRMYAGGSIYRAALRRAREL